MMRSNRGQVSTRRETPRVLSLVMSVRCVPTLAAIVALTTTLSACNNPVEPKPPANRSPIILSLRVFPEAIRDSVIVVCDAFDPDADTLTYDWITDGRLNPKGAQPGEHSILDSSSNSHIFYLNTTLPSFDTVFVQCLARDVRGQATGKLVNFTVQH